MLEEPIIEPTDVNATDENGNTALHRAVGSLQTETVKALLKEGANLNITNRYGLTPLHLAACVLNSSAIFELLLEKEANLYAVDRDGNTVLHLAAAHNNIPVIKRILAKNPAFHKIRNYARNQPLHVAQSRDYQDAVQTLIDSAADPNATNKRQQTPLEVAHEQHNSQDLEILQWRSNSDLEQPEALQHPLGIQVINPASLKNIEENLLAERSTGQAFVDWVHENPGWSAVIAISFFWALFVPTFAIIGAALSKSSKEPVKNFINEFAVATMNGEVDTWNNKPLDIAINHLPGKQMQDAARKQITESQTLQQKAKDEQEKQIKEILLQVLDNAPASFLWNKEKLAPLLTVEERENGDFYLIFTKRYERWETFYSKSEEAKCKQEADLFKTFIQTIFNVNVNREKTQKLKPGVHVKEKAKAFIRSLNVRDISEAKVDAHALQNYYETFEVLARLKKAIEDWGKKKVSNKKLADDINNSLNFIINPDTNEFAIYSQVIDSKQVFDFKLDCTDGRDDKERKLGQKLETYNNSIANLKFYLNTHFGQNAFNLMGNFEYKVDMGSFEFKCETILTVPSEGFQTILEQKEEPYQSPAKIFPHVFNPDEQVEQSASLESDEEDTNKLKK